ncbi:MAG: hypothetical protein JNM84_08880 [Planctomycetes bacterium]|nr:hypothetical protein [Planctomycetota bacterium]
MTSPWRLLRSLFWTSALAVLPSELASAQQPEVRRTAHDPLGLWSPRTIGWNLPLASGAPPYHHRIFAQPASLELWGRPIPFGYFAGNVVDRPLGQRFSFGEGRQDIVWIGETRHALAQRVFDTCEQSWRKEIAPRQPEAAWDAPLASEAAWDEAEVRLGSRAWGERLRDPQVSRASTVLEWAQARGEHELLFALGPVIARQPGSDTPPPSSLELAGLLAALGHSNHPHELLRTEIDARTRLGSEGSRERLLAALRDGWSSLAAELVPELDRARQALAQLDRASPRTLRLGAQAAMKLRFPELKIGTQEPNVFPAGFRLHQRRSAGSGSKDRPANRGAALRFEGGQVKLARGSLGPWSEEVALERRAEGQGAFAISGTGVLLLEFEVPQTVSSASLRLRHRLEAPEGDSACGILVTIDRGMVLDASTAIPRSERCSEQSFDLTEHFRAQQPHMLMLSLAPGAPAAARYWLTELELSIEE